MKRFVQQWGGAIAVYIWLVGFCFYSFLLISPSSLWFEYYSIEPETATVGQQIRLKSTYQINRKVDMGWNDVLYCKNGAPNSYIFHSSSDTLANNLPPTDGKTTIIWKYPHVPETPTECYMVSTISIYLPWGIKKTKQIIGDKFNVDIASCEINK